ncbi:hypothetical protein GCM10007242_08200 [Pigmentiphaga litoralis]|nr:hypothetical protein GCM10007242_08200 [Pigmentiphaga litoralis]
MAQSLRASGESENEVLAEVVGANKDMVGLRGNSTRTANEDRLSRGHKNGGAAARVQRA